MSEILTENTEIISEPRFTDLEGQEFVEVDGIYINTANVALNSIS